MGLMTPRSATFMRFEHSHHLSTAEYADIRAACFGFRRSRRALRLSLAIAVSVVCLFWEYTFLLGMVMLVVTSFVVVAPRFLPATAARNYRELRVPR